MKQTTNFNEYNIVGDDSSLTINNSSGSLVSFTNGNLGIGTISPTEKLEVNEGYIRSTGLSTSHGFELARDNSPTYQIKHLDGGLTIFNLNATRKEMTFKGNGRIGINNSSPIETLDVNGNIKADGILKLYDITDTQKISLNPDGNSYISGNLGIGTTTPSYKLDVSGSSIFRGNLHVSSDNPVITVGDADAAIRYSALRFSTNGGNWYFSSGDSNTGTGANPSDLWITRENDGSDNRFRFYRDIYAFGIYSGSNANVVLNADGNSYLNGGNVGIGTSSPTEILDVRGVIVAGDTTATTGATSFKQFYTTTGNYLTTIGSEYSSGGFVFGYGVEPKKSSLGVKSTTNVNIFRSKLQLNGDKLVLSFASRQNTPIGDDITDFEDSFIFTNGTFRFDGILQLYDITDTQKISLNPDGNSYINVGNVGIGTTTPTRRLHISKTDGNNELVTLRIDNNLGYSEFGTQSNYARILSNGDLLYAGNLSTTFFYLGNESIQTFKIVNSKGYIGISNQNPTEKLDVNGNIKADGILKLFDITDTQKIEFNPDGDSYINGNFGIGTTSPALQSAGTGLHINAINSSELKFTNSTSGATSSNGTALVFNNNNFSINNREVGSVTIGTSNSIRMTISSGGNIGIGTTTPTEKLDVDGNIKSSGYITGKRCGAAGYLASPVNVTVTTANTYYPIGVFTVPVAADFIVGTTYPNGLKYTGTIAQTFHITWNATIESTSNNVTATIDIQRNGVSIAMSKMGTYAKTGGEIYNLSGQCVVDLDTNDEVRFVVTADTNGEVLTFDYFAASIKEFFD